MSLPIESDPFVAHRLEMVESQLQARGVRDQGVLDAMLRVPRHEFVEERFRDQAYEDHPIPIGEDQTISQPYIVALMLEALELARGDRVLEVGTGSGYVTALLAELTALVFSIERHAPLATQARHVLAKLGYTNAEVIVGDGSQGLPDFAPFDAIIVSAAAADVPGTLLSQLAPAGRMIIPVGAAESQQLQLIRMRNGQPLVTLREACRFVPLISSE